jgi:transcriptional regulator with XRE-family HTH domain
VDAGRYFPQIGKSFIVMPGSQKMEAQMKINGDMVRALREEKSWSQEHLADAAGLSARTIQRVESDGVGSAETRLALAAALGVPLSSLTQMESPAADQTGSWTRIPAGAWMGWGLGAACSIGAVTYNYLSGAVTVEQASRSLGLIFAMLGTVAGIMSALRGWALSRAGRVLSR